MRRRKIVLFVDKANTGTSQLLKGWAQKQNFNAGTQVNEGEPMGEGISQALDQIGAASSSLIAKSLTYAHLDQATLLLCDTNAVRQTASALARFPEQLAKVKV